MTDYSPPSPFDLPRSDPAAVTPPPSRHPATLGSAGRAPERRQLFARDRRLGPDARLVYIAAGQADAIRPDCQAGHFICPVPGCADPRYTSRGGARRDHFVHLRAPTDSVHSPESWFHLIGKHLIGDWLRSQYPEAHVRVDDEAVDNGQRPDVLVTLHEQCFAFEIQYSPLSLAEWSRRHWGYEEQGIVDIWLLGHIPPHLCIAPGERDSPRFMLSSLHAEMLAKGCTVRWINPDEYAIHTLITETIRGPAHGRRDVEVASDSLADCHIEDGRFITPSDLRLAEERARREGEAARAEAERARLAEEVRQQWEAALAKAAAERSQIESERQERRRRADLAKEPAWTPVREAIVKQLGFLPEIITDPVAAERGIFTYLPAHWRWLLFRDHIQGKVGDTFTVKQALSHFASLQPEHVRAASRAIGAYLFHLRDKGYITFENNGYWIEDRIRVLRDISPLASPTRTAGDARLEAATDVVFATCAQLGLSAELRPFADGGGAHCWIRAQGKLRWLFAFCLNGLPVHEDLDREHALCLERGISAYWFALQVGPEWGRVGSPVYHLAITRDGTPKVLVPGRVFLLAEFIASLIEDDRRRVD